MSGAPARDHLAYQIGIRLVVVALLFVVCNLGIVLWLYVHDTDQLDDDLITLEAHEIAGAVSGAARAGSDPKPGLVAPRSSRWAFAVRHVDGRIVLEHADPGIDIESVRSWKPGRTGTQREEQGDGFLVAGTRRIGRGDQALWIAVAVAGKGLGPFLAAIESEVLERVLLPLVPLTLLLLLFDHLAVRSTLKPLSAAVRDANALDPAMISRRLREPVSPWEVRALVMAVNGGLDRLERGIRALQEFAADVAHELRTPLAVMTLTIGRLPDTEERRKLQQDAEAMARLINQMLDMAYASTLEIEEGARADLSALGKEVVSQLTPLAIARNREIRFEDAGGAVIRGHAEAVARALRNVIENALVHTPPGTAVEVSSGPGPQYAIRDHGPGIPVAQRETLFERFRRGDRREGGGRGLGLAIVRAIMRAHGGRVDIADPPGGGAAIRLVFRPMAASEAAVARARGARAAETAGRASKDTGDVIE